MTRDRSLLALLAMLVALAVAIGTAFAEDVGPVAEPPLATTPADAGADANAVGDAAPATFAAAGPLVGGTGPMRDGAAVPGKWLPPGASEPDRGPSAAIYPPQQLTIRFDHKKHVVEQKLSCETCHTRAASSDSSTDTLTPKGTLCDSCHGTDHTNLSSVTPGDQEGGKCNYCHLGYKDGDGNKVARFFIPRPNLVFSHKKHVGRNIGCRQCHGEVQELELATRDQLPRMRGCLGCHQRPDSASRGEAKAACDTCHVKEAGRMQTLFASGKLAPPRWMHNAEHGPDFVQRHKYVAANDSAFCASCHKEEECAGCHDGRVRPRSIHPNDYLSMHPVEARLATQKCTSCHREQSFCLGCHQRLGVSMSGPAGARNSGRFHPPKAEWSDAPRKPGHHAFEAMRNLNACVSCHIERDCVVCHGAQGVGGGFNPHPGSFMGSCRTQLDRNPRPCYVCHAPGSSSLARCR